MSPFAYIIIFGGFRPIPVRAIPLRKNFLNFRLVQIGVRSPNVLARAVCILHGESHFAARLPNSEPTKNFS